VGDKGVLNVRREIIYREFQSSFDGRRNPWAQSGPSKIEVIAMLNSSVDLHNK